MKIEIAEFVEGAKNARGVTVIIDVFRAFSVACYASDAGASALIATGSVDEAFRLRTAYRNAVLAGERDERKVPGFDFGNSPTEIIQANLQGKTMIHTTTAGTQGLVSATRADLVLTGSLVNAAAIAAYIRDIDPPLVSLVAMGYRAEISAAEDLLCAEYIAGLLNGKAYVTDKDIRDLMNSSGKRFFNPENSAFSPPSDFFLCTMKDRFPFVLKADTRTDGNVALIRNDI